MLQNSIDFLLFCDFPYLVKIFIVFEIISIFSFSLIFKNFKAQPVYIFLDLVTLNDILHFSFSFLIVKIFYFCT